jgi:hypothetical protein|tara:strand:- start:585 stop:833 length:249 start_codon:yes stop_codon:yes gene_type:complete
MSALFTHGDHAKIGDFVQYCKGTGELMDDFGLVIAVKHQTSPKLVDWLDGQSLKMLQVYSVTVPCGHEDWVNAQFFRIRSKA